MGNRSAEKRAKWTRIMERQASSGLSVAAFCRREGIRSNHFWWWRRRLAGTATSGRTVPASLATFLELPVSSVSRPAELNGDLEVRTGGHTIRVGASAKATLVSSVFKALGRAARAC